MIMTWAMFIFQYQQAVLQFSEELGALLTGCLTIQLTSDTTWG